MKVLHVAAGNLFGGIETYLVTLARLRHLCPAMEPHFGVCFPGRLRDELLATGAPVHDLGAVRIRRPWTVWFARRRLRQVMRGIRFDAAVAHSSWSHAVFAPVVLRTGARLAHALHGEIDRGHWLNRWAARTPPHVVLANSRFIATAAAAQLFPRTRSAVAYPPLPASAATADDRDRIRREFGAGSGEVVILVVSRIEDLKGHAVLIDALVRLRDLPGWVCWVVGGAQRPHEVALLAALRARAAPLGSRVRMVGPRSDVAAVMAGADVYCQPNTGPEGFGLTFVEALSAGLPVVTSGFGGATEIVDDSCGVLTPPGDPAAVADTLRELVEDRGRRRRLGDAGPRRAAALCDPGRAMRRFVDILAGGAATCVP